MVGHPLLLDVSSLCCDHTDGALEYIYKAIGSDPPGDDIWSPHDNPFVRRLVELFTARGLERSEAVQAALRGFLSGAAHNPVLTPSARPGLMRRWDLVELNIAKLYLEALPPEAYTLDDWMLVVDYIVHLYLGAGDLRTEADWLATRANIMGRVAASMAADETKPRDVDTILAALPEDVTAAAAAWGMNIAQQAAIDFGRARCAEHVTALSDAFRHRMRGLITDFQEGVFLGNRTAAAESLQGRLLDEFGLLNRDWRRIAVTEATENIDQGFIASLPAGTKVKRVEKYRGACPFCRSINGRVMTIVPATAPDKDGETDVWVGKTNVGRSASPRRRVGSDLVDREDHEIWWVAAGAMHPHCRGAWVKTAGAPADPIFDAWLESLRRSRRST